MKYLKIEIEKILLDICKNVYLESADDDSPLPYLVYSISNAVNNGDLHSYILDVDIWDKSETTRNIDDLEKKLKKIDKTTYIDENIQFTMYYDRTINTKSEHLELKRYTVMFEIRAIERR
jgi:hypothetical protein|nr:MAG TPA: PORTAL PROTEIN, 15 PROTEIN, HEAD PROTEIN, VIRAL INFECTION, TAILED.2A [Caudoviricetes sp.]